MQIPTVGPDPFWWAGKDRGKAVVDVSYQLKSPYDNFCLATQLENGSQVLQDGDDCSGHLQTQFTNRLSRDSTKKFSGNVHFVTRSVYSTSIKALIMH